MIDHNSIWNIVDSIFVFLFGIWVVKLLCGYFKTYSQRAIYLYLWHTVFCFLYLWYVSSYGGDVLTYYNNSLSGNVNFSLGTDGVIFLTSIFTNIIGFSYYATSLVYNIIGCIGLLAFDASLRFIVHDKNKHLRRLATIIVFLPSISFWSSAIGKDSIAFLSIGLALWAAINYKKRIWLMFPAILIMFLVRPHIAGVLIFSFSLSILIKSRLSPFVRIAIGSIAVIACIYLVPVGISYSKAENVSSSNELSRYINKRSSYNRMGGGGIDISNMPLPLKVGTYLFRPLPFEVKNISFLAASIDNMLLFYLFIIGIYAIIKKHYHSKGENRVFMWTYSLITLLLLSSTTANLGISMRQKWMFVPMLIFLMISVLGRKQDGKQKLNHSAAL